MRIYKAACLFFSIITLTLCFYSAPVAFAASSSETVTSASASAQTEAKPSSSIGLSSKEAVIAAASGKEASSKTTSSMVSSLISEGNSSSQGTKVENKEKIRLATVNVSSGSLHLRKEPTVESSSLSSFENGDTVTIFGEIINGKDGKKWYKTENGNVIGYVCADYITNIREKPAEYEPDASFEDNLTKQKFPESYKKLLRELHAAHPNWIFLADHLEISWAEALAAESAVGKSLISTYRNDSYKSMEYGAYDWTSGKYVGFDGSSWVTADREIVAYFMEPRNFLNENGIFQFLDQSYDEKIQNLEGIKKIVAGKFLDNKFPEDTNKTYSDIIEAAAKKSKVSPYVLAAMIIQEQGSKGDSGSISGKVSGYEGYYNYFNIGAYKSGGLTAVQRGLKYATGAFSSDKAKEKYGLPWNTRAKSIVGGAIWYGSGYIEVGQDTLYYKKFDFIGPSYYSHQYMSNIEGANSEAKIMKSAYAGVPTDTALTFSIPVFKEMPAENKTSLPSGNGPNNYYLKELSVAGLSLTPSYDKYERSYEMVVDSSVQIITVKATPVGNATVSGTGEHTLKEGENIIKLTVTAESGRTADYTISVTRRSGGQLANPNPEISLDAFNLGTNITGISPETSVDTFKSKIKVKYGTIKLTDASGKEKASGNIATGDKLTVYKTDGKEFLSKSIIVYGDISGDGKISIIDLANVQKHILKVKTQEGVFATAADTNKDGKISIIDLANVQKHILKVKTIAQ